MNTPARKTRRPRRLLLVLVSIPLVLVLLWTLATSSWFLQSVVLPRAARAMDATLEVDSIRLRPFSSLDLTGLRFATADGSVDASVASLETRYSLRDILRGTITVDRVLLDQPRIHLKPDPGKVTEPKDPADTGPATVALNIREVRITNGAFRLTLPDQEVSAEGLNLTLGNLVTNQPASLDLEAGISYASGPADRVALKLALNSGFTLTPELTPASATLAMAVELTETAGAFAEAREVRRVQLDADLKPDRVESLELAFFTPGDETLGRVRLSGPLDPATLAADLRLQVEDIGAPVLNLAGSANGMSFGDTRLAADLRVTVAEGAGRVSTSGYVTGEHVSIRSGEHTTPRFSFSVHQEANADLNAATAELRDLRVRAVDAEDRDMLTLLLSEPTRVAWGGEEPEVGDLILALVLERIDLAEWQAVLGPNLVAGTVRGRIELTAADQGKDLRLVTQTGITGLSVRHEEMSLENISISLSGSLGVKDMKSLGVESLALRVARADSPVVHLETSGTADIATGAAEFSTRLQLDLAALAGMSPVPVAPLELRGGQLSGTLDLSMASLQAGAQARANFAVSGLDGKAGDLSLEGLALRFGGRVEQAADRIRVDDLTASLQRKGESVLRLTAVARMQPEPLALSDTRVEIQELHLPVLAEWLSPADLRVVSGVLSGTLVPSLRNGLMALRTDLTLNDFLARGEHTPEDTPPQTVVLTASLEAREAIAELKEMKLSWTATDRAENRLSVAGSFDGTDPEALALRVQSTGGRLDLTPWMHMFAATDATPAPAEAPPPPARTGPGEEPPPVRLPLREAEISLGFERLFLEELETANLRIHVLADPHSVEAKEISLTLNDTPFKASALVDLSRPGYRYTLRGRLDPLELQPWVDTLAPAFANRFKGLLEADFSLEGEGVTGPSIRNNLNGNFRALLTDAEIRWADLDHMANQGVTSVKNLLLGLLRAVAPALGIPPGDLINPPIHEMKANLRVGDGQLDVETFRVVNDSFRVSSAGRVSLADEIEDSRIRDIPVVMAVNTNIAKRARVYRPERVRDDMLELPPFIRVRGTLGEPDIDVQRRVITGLIAGGVVDAGVGGERTQRVLDGIGGILTGEGPRRPTPTPSPTPSAAEPTPAATPTATPAATPTPTPRPTGAERLLRRLEDRL